MNIDRLSFEQWSRQLCISAQIYDIVPTQISEQSWKSFALRLNQDPRFSKFSPPIPDQIADWREWAKRFKSSVGNAFNE